MEVFATALIPNCVVFFNVGQHQKASSLTITHFFDNRQEILSELYAMLLKSN